jgi:hypothetical protein
VKISGKKKTKRSSPRRNACLYGLWRRHGTHAGGVGTLGATAALAAVAGCDEPPVDGPDRQARGLDVYPQCLVFLSLNHSVATPKWPRGPVVTSRHSPHLIRAIFSSGLRKRASRPPTCTTRGPKKCTTSNNPRADATAIDPGSGSPWPRSSATNGQIKILN